MTVVQRNVRRWLEIRNWNWWRLYTRVKPLLSVAHAEEERRGMEEELAKLKEEMTKMRSEHKQLEVICRYMYSTRRLTWKIQT